jgi:hypothetical protein
MPATLNEVARDIAQSLKEIAVIVYEIKPDHFTFLPVRYFLFILSFASY